jgi:hypothetical protein
MHQAQMTGEQRIPGTLIPRGAAIPQRIVCSHEKLLSEREPARMIRTQPLLAPDKAMVVPAELGVYIEELRRAKSLWLHDLRSSLAGASIQAFVVAGRAFCPDGEELAGQFFLNFARG